jgi:hypothetical protein
MILMAKCGLRKPFASLALSLVIIAAFSLYIVSQLILSAQNTYALSWKTETVEKYVGKFTSIAVDSSGKPHISYYDAGNGYLKYAVKSSNSWLIENVTKAGPGNDGSSFIFSSIAVDSSGKPHISYYDENDDLLKYAVKSSNGNWNVMTVDSGKYSGLFTSLAIDSSNNPHISYHGFAQGLTNGDLKYAVKSSNGNWTTEVVDSDGDTGLFTSLAIDSSNNPHISYGRYPSLFAHSQAILKYASKSNGSWTTEVVNSTDNVGWYTSLAIDSSNNPHISYYEENNGFLKYASKSNGSWTTEVVDSSGDVWRFTSLAIDSSNNPHISYFNITDKDLKYASKSNGSWTKEVVDSSGDVGRFTSIALDSSSNIHISYYNATFPFSLKYASATLPRSVESPITVGEVTLSGLKYRVTVETKCTESVGRACLHMEVVRVCVGAQCFNVPKPGTPPCCPACDVAFLRRC